MKDKIYNIYKKYILIIANKKYPEIRKRKFSLEYYLKNFLYILNDLVNWSSLKIINNDNKTYHWKTIYNEFNKWSSDNIFEEAFYQFMKNNYFKISQIKKNKKLNMFIDVTKINNKYGKEEVTINNEYKKKNVTGLTIVCDQNNLPLSVTCVSSKRLLNNNRKTATHDIKNVQKTLDKINLPSIKNYIKTTITADKGYISKELFNIFDRKIKIITPKRKNQKIRTSNNDKKYLQERYKIEHVFAKLKNNNRIVIRKEKSINNYLSFIYISFFEIYLEHVNNKNIKLRLI